VFNDMLGGRVDVLFGNISGALALYRDGLVKVLAVTDKVRAAAMPEIPTTAEAGLPGLLSIAWYAMVGPPKLKAQLRDQVANATIEVLKMPDVQQKFVRSISSPTASLLKKPRASSRKRRIAGAR
jgi:tripartite-type tricarboxylate transporter receptor subunit TctC